MSKFIKTQLSIPKNEPSRLSLVHKTGQPRNWSVIGNKQADIKLSVEGKR